MAVRRDLLVASLGAALLPRAGAVARPQQPAALTVKDVIARNVSARGGAQAWAAVSAMAWEGHAEAAAEPGRPRPFLLLQRRPDQMRFEVVSEGLRSVRVFDGSAGWKLRLNPATGRPELQDYGPEEISFARASEVIDGPLMSYARRSAMFTLAGQGAVEGRPAHVVDVKLPSGGGHRVWVDAQTYLELRHDRPMHGPNAQPAMFSVMLREYQDFKGLKLPTVIENSAAPGQASTRLVIERVALNPEVSDEQFRKPLMQTSRRHGVVVDTRKAAEGGVTVPAHP